MKKLALSWLLFCSPVWAGTFTVDVTFPNQEKKQFKMAERLLPIRLGTSDWTCASIAEKKQLPDGTPAMRASLVCMTPGGKQTITSAAVCTPKLTAEVANLTLGDSERKEWQFLINCVWGE